MLGQNSPVIFLIVLLEENIIPFSFVVVLISLYVTERHAVKRSAGALKQGFFSVPSRLSSVTLVCDDNDTRPKCG